MCKHSTQIGYKSGNIFKKIQSGINLYTQSVQNACTQVYASNLHRLGILGIPNLCRMLAHRYMQAFYTDWVYKLWHSTQIGYIFELSKMYPICVECLRIIFNPWYILLAKNLISDCRSTDSITNYLSSYPLHLQVMELKI